MYNTMIDFSRINRQINEEPFANQRQQGQGRFNRHNDGGFGTMAEDRTLELLQKINPNSTFEQLGDSNTLKTDIIQRQGNNSRGYSVKATKDPSVPVKVNSANSQVGSRGSFRKMLMNGSDNKDLFTSDYNYLNTEDGRNRFIDIISDNPAARAYLMSYGLGSRRSNGGNFDLKELVGGGTMSQNRLLDQVSQRGDNPFLKPDELKEAFPDEFEAFMEHLQDNKGGIFNQMVRQHQSRYPSNSYQYGDAKPIDMMAHLVSQAKYNRVFTDKGERRDPTHVDIRDVSDSAIEEAMEYVKWYNDGNNFYLAPEETDDWNKRLLDINPMNASVNAWGAKPGVNRRNLNHMPASSQPGRQITTMGVDEGMLNDVFGEPLWSKNVYSTANEDGTDEGISHIESR
jgi:hypothetical protein